MMFSPFPEASWKPSPGSSSLLEEAGHKSDSSGEKSQVCEGFNSNPAFPQKPPQLHRQEAKLLVQPSNTGAAPLCLWRVVQGIPAAIHPHVVRYSCWCWFLRKTTWTCPFTPQAARYNREMVSLLSKCRKMLEQHHSVSPSSGYWLSFSFLSFRSEPSAIWSAQHSHRKALRLFLMRQSWPFSTPRRRRSAVQSATGAAPLCDVPWEAEPAEFSETKQVRKAMKVTHNWNGEHDQKRVLLTQI